MRLWLGSVLRFQASEIIKWWIQYPFGKFNPSNVLKLWINRLMVNQTFNGKVNGEDIYFLNLYLLTVHMFLGASLKNMALFQEDIPIPWKSNHHFLIGLFRKQHVWMIRVYHDPQGTATFLNGGWLPGYSFILSFAKLTIQYHAAPPAPANELIPYIYLIQLARLHPVSFRNADPVSPSGNQTMTVGLRWCQPPSPSTWQLQVTAPARLKMFHHPKVKQRRRNVEKKKYNSLKLTAKCTWKWMVGKLVPLLGQGATVDGRNSAPPGM